MPALIASGPAIAPAALLRIAPAQDGAAHYPSLLPGDRSAKRGGRVAGPQGGGEGGPGDVGGQGGGLVAERVARGDLEHEREPAQVREGPGEGLVLALEVADRGPVGQRGL